MKSKASKVLIIGMLVVFCFSMIGCGGDSPPATTPSPDGTNSAPAASAQEPEFVWTVTSAWSAGFGFNEYVQQHMDMIEKYSDGRIKIDLYTGNEIVPSLETWDGIEAGLVDAGHL